MFLLHFSLPSIHSAVSPLGGGGFMASKEKPLGTQFTLTHYPRRGVLVRELALHLRLAASNSCFYNWSLCPGNSLNGVQGWCETHVLFRRFVHCIGTHGI